MYRNNITYNFKCIRCGYKTEKFIYICPKCSFIPEIDYSTLKWRVHKDRGNIWRYSAMLPRVNNIISLGEGVTPLRKINNVYIKDETKNPTRSYIDRGSSVITSYFDIQKEIKLPFQQDFTISISSYLKQLNTNINVIADPISVDPIEILYLASLGVEIVFNEEPSSLNPSFNYENPLIIEGLKTISYELFEQSKKINIEGVVIPSESGILAYSIAKGYHELVMMEQIDEIPEIILAISSTHSVPDIIRYIKNTKISIYTVESKDILKSMTILARKGIYVKPVSASAYAVSNNLGANYIAIISGSSLRQMPKPSLNKLTELQKEIIEVISIEGELTAYQVWKRIKGYTLQGVYKALNKLVSLNKVTKEIKMIKNKKVSFYKLKD